MSSITLTRSAQQVNQNAGVLASYSFKVVATNSTSSLPNQIFKLNQRPLDPIAQTYTSDFEGVCTPFDINTLPINAPIPPATTYRVDTITVTYQTTTDGDNAWQDIQDDVLFLLQSWDANTTLNNQQVVVISD